MLAEANMKNKILSLFFILITISTVSAKEVLVIGTYDSFSAEWGPGPIIEAEFEKICECDIQYISTSQAGTLANEIFLKDKIFFLLISKLSTVILLFFSVNSSFLRFNLFLLISNIKDRFEIRFSSLK